jgi:CTD nuclear envelope phosphatase 1
LFTELEEKFAEEILKFIDPDRIFFKTRLYRHHCSNIDSFLMKDLDIFMDRNLQNIVILASSILQFGFHLDNGIVVRPFEGSEETDNELLSLIALFEELFLATDVSTQLKESFKLSFLQSNTDASKVKLDSTFAEYVESFPFVSNMW